MPLLGAHISIAEGPQRALIRGERIGCRVIQIFTRSRVRWSGKRLSEREIQAFFQVRKRTSVWPVSIHNSYLINLASPDPHMRKNSFYTLLDEMAWAECLGIPYLVMHPGAHLGDGEKRGLQRISRGLDKAFERCADDRLKILMETTAGQGTNLGYRFEHLAEICEGSKYKARLGVCFDTCHVFASGYDFRTIKSYRQLIGEFDRIIGLDRLKLFHVNDSTHDLGSRRDRHAHPGKGRIGLGAFSFFLNDPRLTGLPFLLETPKGRDEKGVDLDLVNLNLLRRLTEKAVDQ